MSLFKEGSIEKEKNEEQDSLEEIFEKSKKMKVKVENACLHKEKKTEGNIKKRFMK